MQLPSEMRCRRAAGKLSVTSPGDARYLRYLRALVCDSARAVGFDAMAVAKIEMAVDEACTNVLKHAYAPNTVWRSPGQTPEIRILIDTPTGFLIVEINDHGRSFDFDREGTGDLKERMARLETSGYGIPIIRRFMDVVEYTSSAETGNTLRMGKAL